MFKLSHVIIQLRVIYHHPYHCPFQEKTLKREAMAEICAKAERYVGTEGGGMDQVGRFRR